MRLKNIPRKKSKRIIDSIKSLGFYGSTVSGISVSVFDNQMVEEKDELIEEAEKKVTGVESDYQEGLDNQRRKKETYPMTFGLRQPTRLRI